MNGIEIAYTLYIIVVILLSLIAIIYTRAESHKEFLTKVYTLQISEQLNLQNMQNISANNNHEREALLDALRHIIVHSYGIDHRILCKIIYDNSLDEYIMKTLFSTWSSYRKARMLHLLSYLPHNYEVTKLKRFRHSSDADIRRGALLAILADNPSMAIANISKLKHELSAIDITHIISLLRRNLLPIACEPLLKSPNKNLCLLGMAIVSNFNITMAEQELHSILSHSRDQRIIREAIFTLCSIGSTLQSRPLRQQIIAGGAEFRKTLCRHLSVEGYSIDTIRQIIPGRDSLLAEKIILSHKRQLYTSSEVS